MSKTSVTKKDIVKKITDKLGTSVSQTHVKEIVQMTLDLVIETLETHGKMELRKFGVFVVKRRKARQARNPQDNKPVHVPAKNVVTFHPGKIMEERIQRAVYPEDFFEKKTKEPVDSEDFVEEQITSTPAPSLTLVPAALTVVGQAPEPSIHGTAAEDAFPEPDHFRSFANKPR